MGEEMQGEVAEIVIDQDLVDDDIDLTLDEALEMMEEGESAEIVSPPDDEPDDSDSSNNSPDSSNGVTEELISEMHNAFNYWHTHGYPEKASVIWECIQQNRRPPANLLPSNLTGIKPETTIDPSALEVPPRSGRNATHLIWREFAKKVIDMEPEIIDTLERGDIIGILEDKGVIEKKGEGEQEK